jgi:hypothetical protein
VERLRQSLWTSRLCRLRIKHLLHIAQLLISFRRACQHGFSTVIVELAA